MLLYLVCTETTAGTSFLMRTTDLSNRNIYSISHSSLCFPCSFNLWWSLSIISDGLFTSVTIFHHFITILFLYVLLCTTFNSFVFPLVTKSVVRERLQISAKRSSKWMAIFKYVLEHYKQIITLLYTKGISPVSREFSPRAWFIRTSFNIRSGTV